ncbi:rab GTPase-activating protein 1-like [Lingula anatina]|uniref:Rab GTPase-activating protein 1-like n=1 Tax=Lingula anatina TaxID=7574 RepID=A0A2R2MR37_LINAN|nr:rab GTPase-activating protein 1-like [Lingula anatina]|eukprot:XP_023932472.1 rab GTPase-activating protein 1-like [Lingula anatina]
MADVVKSDYISNSADPKSIQDLTTFVQNVLQQMQDKFQNICFGMLISPGRNVKHSDMHLLDMVHMGQGNDGKVYIISGNWDPKDSAFGILNTETPKDTRVFMTVAVDLVIAGIREPVRFVIETKAKIFPQNERFWYINKKPLQEKFHLKLKEVESTDGDEAAYEVVSIVSQTEKDRKKANLSLNISPTKNIPEDVKTPNGDESSEVESNRKELLALDFEGILKYFRVQLPKKYRSEENARELLTTAVSWKISSKKLKKYEKEYMSIKEAQMQQEDPIERYERENKRLMEANMRLEQENDDLAHELVTSKIQLRSDLDAMEARTFESEDKADALAKELLSTKTDLVELEEEKKRLETESAQLKDMCRRELEKLDQESSRNNAIIAEYKQICTQLSERLEKQASASKIDLAKIKEVISGCDRCTKLANTDTQLKSMDTSMTISDGADPNQVLDATKQIRELELELAQTKLALVESECKTQDLTHQLNAALTELQASKNTWFQKTFNSIKEAAAKRDPKERDSKDHKEKERENKERKESMT